MSEDNGYYDVVRHYFNGGKRIIKRNVTLTEAQEHCRNPETSSRTCTSAAGKHRTRIRGPWFDGYEDSRSGR